MIEKITWEDKQTLRDRPKVPHKNKIIAEDMNSLKRGVNNLVDGTNYKLYPGYDETKSKFLNISNGNIGWEIIVIPVKVSELENDENFIKNSVNNLVNYYLKSETYTKEEVNSIVGNIQTLNLEIVQELPQTGDTNKTYLVPRQIGQTDNIYDEYVYVNNKWECIGSTQADLNNYYTKGESDAKYVTKTEAQDFPTNLNNGQGNYSIEQLGSEASGESAVALGNNTTASGYCAFASGLGTRAGVNQTALGAWNIEDSDSAVIVGNGVGENTRANAHTIDWSGNAWFNGNVYVGSTSGKYQDSGSLKLATEAYVDTKTTVAGDTLPIGSVVEYAADTAPENWLLCNGQEVSRADYADLYAVIGTTWGSGNGSTTFNVPNKEGLVTVGKKATDTSFASLGKTGGTKTQEHDLNTNSAVAAIEMNTDGTIDYGEIQAPENIAKTYTVATGGSGTTKSISNKYGAKLYGKTSSESNLQPYITSNFIIKAKQSVGVLATVVDGLDSTSTTDALSANAGHTLNAKIDGLITSGTTPEGFYTKFPDGTMICRGEVTLTSSEQKTSGGLTYYRADTYINFPAEFSNTNTQEIQMTSEARHENMNYMCYTYAAPQSKTQARISLQTTQNNYERKIMWTAIGRWK